MPRINRHDNWTYDNWDERYKSLWEIAIEPGDAFRVGGPANRLKPRTVWNNERAFGRYQEFLKRTGRRDEGLLPHIDNLRSFNQELMAQNLADYSRLAIFTQLTGALRLMLPDADLQYLAKVAVRLASVAKTVRSVEPRLIDPINLIKIGVDLMQEALRVPDPCWRTAHRFGIGALISSAAQFPLRHGNWSIMIIGRHIDLVTGRVMFAAEEMKRREPFEGTLSPEVLVPLRLFVSKYRPLLLDPNSVDEGYLWPSNTGGMLHRNTLGMAVKRAIRRRTGKDFNFHLFRHSAATFISETSPEQTRMVAGLLHHSRLRTSDKHYIRGNKRRAFKLFQRAVREVIVKERRKRARQRRRGSK